MKIGMHFEGIFQIDLLDLRGKSLQTYQVELEAKDVESQLKGNPEEVFAMLQDDLESSIFKALRSAIKERRQNAELEHARADQMEHVLTDIRTHRKE